MMLDTTPEHVNYLLALFLKSQSQPSRVRQVLAGYWVLNRAALLGLHWEWQIKDEAGQGVGIRWCKPSATDTETDG